MSAAQASGSQSLTKPHIHYSSPNANSTLKFNLRKRQQETNLLERQVEVKIEKKSKRTG